MKIHRRVRIIAAVCATTIACGKSSPTAVTPQTVDVSGNWSGAISSARAGNGTLLLILTPDCLPLLPPGRGCEVSLMGKWTTLFENPAYSDSGSVGGTVQDSTARITLGRRDPNICPFVVTATANRTSMHGTFGGQFCIETMTFPPADSGTVSLLKVEGAVAR